MERSEETKTKYAHIVSEFILFLEDREIVDIRKVKTQHVQSFLEERTGSLKRNTKRLYAYAIRSFFNFLLKTEVIKKNPAKEIPVPKKERKAPSFLSREEVRKLINATESLRDRLLTKVFLFTGVRASEAVNITWDDISLETGVIRVLGKGGKERFIPIHPELKKDIKEMKKKDGSGYLFKSIRKKKLSRRRVRTIVAELGKKAGIKKKVYPHLLRHTFASHMAQSGVSLVELKDILGHEDISTTSIYLHATDRRLKKAVEMLSYS